MVHSCTQFDVAVMEMEFRLMVKVVYFHYDITIISHLVTACDAFVLSGKHSDDFFDLVRRNEVCIWEYNTDEARSKMN